MLNDMMIGGSAMRVTRNPKILAGACILITSSAFMLAADAGLNHIPLPILLVQLLSFVVGSILLLLGVVEEKNLGGSNSIKFAGSTPKPDPKSILKTGKE
jgi:hypothetical protein